MSILISESEYENQIIEKLKKLGWRYLNYEDLFTLRDDVSNVILWKELSIFLKESQNLEDEQMKIVRRKLKDLNGASLEEGNKEFHKCFVEGIKVFDKVKKNYKTVKLYKNNFNRFIITNQLKTTSNHYEYDNQVADIVLYLNGLPVVVMELKRPNHKDTTGIELAYNQIENYKEFIKKLFVFNLFNIVSDGDLSKFGSLTASFSRYSNWRGENFKSSISKLFDDLLKPEVFIELTSKYTFYIDESKKVKKIIAGYHQYYGVKSAIKSILRAYTTNKKGGVFWHTQGSGKSYSMIFLARNLTYLMPKTTFIVVTDRNHLDDQLYKNFKLASNYLSGQKIKQIESIKELKDELKNREQDGIFFTTIQKFNDSVGELINRENVIVISDEAHRSHNNLRGRYFVDVQNESYGKKYGSAKYLRVAFPNATFIGFTGTPIEKDDISTTSIFGKLISQYTMAESENDEVTVEINYESRKPELQFDENELSKLDKLNQAINQKIKLESFLSSEIRRKIKKDIKKLENIIGDSDRINGICNDIISHYEKRKSNVAGKAMIVTLNRKIALKYYKSLIKMKPSLKNKINLIFTTNKQSDNKEVLQIAGTKIDRSKKAILFKDPNSNFKIAIVVDMWLTGFDVPSLDTLYLDKPLKMHNLMQAIARTNRVYSDKEKGIRKDSSLIVDYIGIASKLRDALAFYSNAREEEISKTQDIHNYKKEALKNLELIYNNYEITNLKIDFKKCLVDPSYAYKSVDRITELILVKKVQNEFVDISRVLSKILKKTISIITEIERIQFILLLSTRQRLIKMALDDIDFISIKKELLTKMDDSINYTKTVIIDKFKNQVIKLSDMRKFINTRLNEQDQKNLKARQKAIVLKKILEELKKISIEKSSKLSKDLKKLLKKYDDNYIKLEDLLKGIAYIWNEAKETFDRGENDGLSKEERNFYEILEKPIIQSDYDRSKIMQITKELLKIINNEKLVNKHWIYNKKLKMQVRNRLKILLKKYNYPPKNIKTTRDKVVEAIILTKDLF